MDKGKFEQSKTSGGPHYRLNALAGEWEGVTRTWFEPDRLADESPARGTIRSLLEGRFVLHEYRGTLSGEPLEGGAIYGFHIATGKYESVWMDGIHMGTGMMFSSGQGRPSGLSVLGSYLDPGGGPSWGWRTELAQPDPNRLTITAYNISPQGIESKAVEIEYRRKQS